MFLILITISIEKHIFIFQTSIDLPCPINAILLLLDSQFDCVTEALFTAIIKQNCFNQNWFKNDSYIERFF